MAMLAQQNTHYQINGQGLSSGDFTKLNGVLVIDGEEQANPNYEIGVFDQDGVCRGAKKPVRFPTTGKYVYLLQIRGNVGFTYSFKVWDHENNVELDLIDQVVDDNGDPITYLGNYIYQHNGANTSAANPIPLNFTRPGGSQFTKDIVGYGEGNGNWYLISSPIGDVNISEPTQLVDLGLLTTDYSFDLFYFDESQEQEWINYQQEENSLGFEILEKGKGYLYASEVSTTLTFTGTAYSGNSIVTLDKTGVNPNWDGWNLIGNPFADTAYIDRDFYTMNDGGTEIMATLVSRGIAPMEGVFVVAETDGETITFSTEPFPVIGGDSIIEDPDEFKTLTLNLNDGRSLIDRAIVRFGEGRQLPKFQLRSNSTKVYIPKDGSDYAIVRSEGMGEMPVNFKAEKNGTYSLVLGSENVSFSYLHLIDNLTGADVDLLAHPGYTFEASTTDYASRFRLVFATGSSNDDSFAFFSNGSLIISNDGEATVQVIDLNGRVLSSESINGSASVSVKGAAGVYMVRLINGDDVKVQKIVVR